MEKDVRKLKVCTCSFVITYLGLFVSLVISKNIIEFFREYKPECYLKRSPSSMHLPPSQPPKNKEEKETQTSWSMVIL